MPSSFFITWHMQQDDRLKMITGCSDISRWIRASAGSASSMDRDAVEAAEEDVVAAVAVAVAVVEVVGGAPVVDVGGEGGVLGGGGVSEEVLELRRRRGDLLVVLVVVVVGRGVRVDQEGRDDGGVRHRRRLLLRLLLLPAVLRLGGVVPDVGEQELGLRIIPTMTAIEAVDEVVRGGRSGGRRGSSGGQIERRDDELRVHLHRRQGER